MKDILNFRAWFDGRFIYKSLCDSNVYTEDNKCICPANTLPDLPWEQCTGLKDKNGKLIYNGDIIKSPSNSNVLRVYQEDSGLWRCVEYRVGGRKELPLYQLCDYGVEICGNIHENEELFNEMR